MYKCADYEKLLINDGRCVRPNVNSHLRQALNIIVFEVNVNGGINDRVKFMFTCIGAPDANIFGICRLFGSIGETTLMYSPKMITVIDRK